MILTDMQTKLDQRAHDCRALQSFWRSLIPGAYPSTEQFALWLDSAVSDAVIYGVRATAKRFHTLCGKMDGEYQVRYASAVIKNFRPESQALSVNTLRKHAALGTRQR